MEQEIWKQIEDYPKYEVSTIGRVRKINDGRLLNQCLDSKGYPSVNVNDGNKATLKVVHRFVAKAFIPNPENKPCVDHINCDKTDNRAENLRWVTHKENSNNPLSLAKMHEAFSDKEFLKRRVLAKVGKGGKTAPKRVFMYTKDGQFVREFSSQTEAALIMGVTDGNICVAVDHPTKTACGYKWYSKRIEPAQ